MHFIIEGTIKYAMPLYLAIQFKEYLKNCQCKKNDCVAQWISDLGPADRTLVKMMDLRESQSMNGYSSIRFHITHTDDSPLRA
jgi:hypothetical protein